MKFRKVTNIVFDGFQRVDLS